MDGYQKNLPGRLGFKLNRLIIQMKHLVNSNSLELDYYIAHGPEKIYFALYNPEKDSL